MTAHRGADQKAAHAHDPVQALASCLVVPADPLIPIGELDRRSSETQPPQPAVFGANQIAHLRAHQRPGSLWVLAQHQFVPDAHPLQRVDLDQTQTADFACPLGYVLRLFDRCRETARIPDSFRTSGAGSG